MRLRYSIATLFVLVLIAAVGVQLSLVVYHDWIVPRRPIPWVAFTPTAIDAARQDSRVVLLHFTADWDMVTARPRWVMDTPAVRSAIHDHGVRPILADVTHNKSPGWIFFKQTYDSLPLTIVYPVERSKSPIMLPGIVDNADLIAAIENAAMPSTR